MNITQHIHAFCCPNRARGVPNKTAMIISIKYFGRNFCQVQIPTCGIAGWERQEILSSKRVSPRCTHLVRPPTSFWTYHKAASPLACSLWSFGRRGARCAQQWWTSKMGAGGATSQTWTGERMLSGLGLAAEQGGPGVGRGTQGLQGHFKERPLG